MKMRNLERFRTGGSGHHMQLGIPLPRTPGRRVYRFSPNESAHPRHFVLGDVVAEITQSPELHARMKREPRGSQTVCPYSGVVADDEAFIHPEDREAALQTVKHAALQDVEDAVANMLRNAFKGVSSRSGLISITANVKQGSPKPKPRFARRDLMRELVCDHCGRDYGVFAIGLFCPDCGAPNVRLHFAREAELVSDQVSLAEQVGAEAQELSYRLLGNAHEDVLTGFEATLKAIYLYGQIQAGMTPLPKIGNDFQNIERGQKRFADLGVDPFAGLSGAELADLRLNIQKRHVIGHNLGVVDGQFAAHASDARVGETVQLVGEDIRMFAAIAQKVVDSLDDWLGGSPSPTIDQTPLLVTAKDPTTNPDDPADLMGLDLQLSLLARKLALWTVEQCADGRRGFVDRQAMRKAFEESSDDELREAIAELKMDGFVQTSDAMTAGIPAFRPNLELYLTFDGNALGTEPMADAAAVAELALDYEGGVDVEDMFNKTGWALRRYNPVLAYVASQLPDGRVLRTSGSRFAVYGFHLLDEDRVQLKRVIKRLRA